MNDRLQRFEDWINTLNPRERLLMIVAAIAVVYLVWDQALFSPLDVKAKQLTADVQKQQNNLKTVRAQQQQIVSRAGSDPNNTIQKDMQSIAKTIDELDATLQSMTVDLIDPQQMAVVLEEVLTRRTDLKLVRVEALAPQSLGEQITDAEPQDKQAGAKSAETEIDVLPGVYKHTLEIEFTGSYLSTLAYIKELEALQRRFYWGSVNFEISDYPRARVVITVNTLSLNDAWIGV